jgi:hypothetical protein
VFRRIFESKGARRWRRRRESASIFPTEKERWSGGGVGVHGERGHYGCAPSYNRDTKLRRNTSQGRSMLMNTKNSHRPKCYWKFKISSERALESSLSSETKATSDCLKCKTTATSVFHTFYHWKFAWYSNQNALSFFSFSRNFKVVLDQNFRELLFSGICVLMVFKFYTPFCYNSQLWSHFLLQRYPRSYYF